MQQHWANCVNSTTSKDWGIWCRCCIALWQQKFGWTFPIDVKNLLKMTIVRMRQDNSVPGTCRHSELQVAMEKWQVTVSKN